MSMTVNNVLSNYTYSYAGTNRPNLDKDSDGYWSRTEVDNYAADYKSATGEDLDVGAIFEKYDENGDGRLGYNEYKGVISNDALDIGTLTSMKEKGETSAVKPEADKTTSSTSKMSAGNVLSKYTYSYLGTNRPNLDKDSDGYWSKEEVNNYAADYKAATGKELDVESIFSKYDADGDGRLGYNEYNQIISSDALDINTLSSMKAAEDLAAAEEEAAAKKEEETSSATSSDWLTSLSANQKMAFVRATWKAETASNFLNAMFSVQSRSSMGFGLLSAVQSYNSTKNLNKISYSAKSRINTTI